MKRMYSKEEIVAISTQVVIQTLNAMGINFNSESGVLEIANLKITETLRDVMNSTGLEGQALIADANNQPKWTTLE